MKPTFSAVPHELIQDKALRLSDHGVVAELLRLAKGDRFLTASNKALGDALGTCDRTIRRSLERLQVAGWIHRKWDRHSTVNRLIDLKPILDRRKAPQQQELGFEDRHFCPPVRPPDNRTKSPCPPPGQPDKKSAPEPAPYRSARESGEKESGEKEDPLPLGGASPKAESGEILEPFQAPTQPLPPEPPCPVANPPAEVQRVAAKAERYFPACNLGAFVIQLAAEHSIDSIEEAIEKASEVQNANRAYLRSIVRRIEAAGGPRRPVVPRASPGASTPAESKADRIRRIHKALGLEGEPLITDEDIRTHDEEVRRGGFMVRDMAGGAPAETPGDASAGDPQRKWQSAVHDLAKGLQASRDP